MARGTVSVAVPGRTGKKYFYKARLPKGIQSPGNPRIKRALESMDQRLQTGAGCAIVFFKNRGGSLKAVQRCDNRKLSTGAARRWKAMRGKSVCRCKAAHCGKRTKGQFQPCRR